MTTNQMKDTDIILFWSVMGCPIEEEIVKRLQLDNPDFYKTTALSNGVKNWVYMQKFRYYNSFDECLTQFLAAIHLTNENIEWLKSQGTCSLRASLVSEYGQLGIDIGPASLRRIADLNIRFEISVFSWGMCDSD